MSEQSSSGFTVFLDANVLVKPVTRTLIMASAKSSGYGVRWSAYVESEAVRNARLGQKSIVEVRGLSGDELSPSGINPDRFDGTSEKDRQVLADAESAGCLFLVTEDVDDFGLSDLDLVGVAAVNPDLFLSLCTTAEGYIEALTLMTSRFRNPEHTLDQLHSQLGKAHPLTVAKYQFLFSVEPIQSTHNQPRIMYRGTRCLVCLGTRSTITQGRCPDCTE